MSAKFSPATLSESHRSGLLLDHVADKSPQLGGEDDEGPEAELDALEHDGSGGRRRRRRRRGRRRRKRSATSGHEGH